MKRETENPPSRPFKKALAAFLIFAAALIVYIPSFQGGWLWDDDTSIYHNPVVTKPDGIVRIWSTTEDYDFWPMTKTFFWVQYRLFGDEPAGYHRVNSVIQAMAALLVFLALSRMGIPGAWFAGMLFALHPVNVSSVAWVSELKNNLSLAFLALTMLSWTDFERTGRLSWHIVAVLLFACALASKTSVVMFPFFLLVFAWWRRERISRRDILLSIPFFVLSAFMAGMTLFAQDRYFDLLTRPLEGLYRLAGAGWAVWFYICKILLPVNLSMIYPEWKETIPAAGGFAFFPTFTLIVLFGLLWFKRATWWGKPTVFALWPITSSMCPWWVSSPLCAPGAGAFPAGSARDNAGSQASQR